MGNTRHFKGFFFSFGDLIVCDHLNWRRERDLLASPGTTFNSVYDVNRTLLGLLNYCIKFWFYPLINFSLLKWHFINSWKDQIFAICVKICLGTHLIKRRGNIWSEALHSEGILNCRHNYHETLPTHQSSLSYSPRNTSKASRLLKTPCNDRESLAMTWMWILNQGIFNFTVSPRYWK